MHTEWEILWETNDKNEKKKKQKKKETSRSTQTKSMLGHNECSIEILSVQMLTINLLQKINLL